MTNDPTLQRSAPPSDKPLLVIEAVVCFGPVVFFSFFIVLLAPTQVADLKYLPDERGIVAALMLASAAGAVAGFLAIVDVVRHLIGHRNRFLPARAGLIFTAAGVATLAGWFVYYLRTADGISVYWLVFFLMPLAATVHLGWLARDYLFRHQRSAER